MSSCGGNIPFVKAATDKCPPQDGKEPFPPGSLKQFVTPERDSELLEIFKGCSLEVP